MPGGPPCARRPRRDRSRPASGPGRGARTQSGQCPGAPGYSPLLYSSRMADQDRCSWQAPRTHRPGVAQANQAPAASITERTLLGAEAPEAVFSTLDRHYLRPFPSFSRWQGGLPPRA